MTHYQNDKYDYNDIPLELALERAEWWIDRGFVVHQKFTCENCGNRLTIEEPNKFFAKGSCDKCGYVTEIKKCGFITAGVI